MKRPSTSRIGTVILALAVLGLGCLWLTTPVYRVIKDYPDFSRISPRIADRTTVGQVFRCGENGLSRVEVRLGTYHQRTHNPTRFSLYRLAGGPLENGSPPLEPVRLVHRKVFDSSVDNRLRRFDFSPQEDSSEGWYLIELAATVPGESGSIGAWLDPNGQGLVVDGCSRPGGISFRYLLTEPRTRPEMLRDRWRLAGPSWLNPGSGLTLGLMTWLAVLFGLPARGRLFKIVHLFLPLGLILGGAIWLGLSPDQGLRAEYFRGRDQNLRPLTTTHLFKPGEPGVRTEAVPEIRPWEVRRTAGLHPPWTVAYSGKLRAPQTWAYDLLVVSSGQVELEIDGQRLRAGSPPPARLKETSQSFGLNKGWVDFKLTMTQKTEGGYLQVYWARERADWARLEPIDLIPPGTDEGRPWRRQLATLILWLAVLGGWVGLAFRLVDELLDPDRDRLLGLAVLVGLVALLARWLLLAQAEVGFFGPDSTLFRPGGDPELYAHLAHSMGQGVFPRLYDSAFRFNPAFPFLLGGLQTLVGSDPVLLRMALAGFGAGTASLCFLIGHRLGGPGLGLLAGIMAAWSGIGAAHEIDLLIAGPLTFGLILAGYRLTRVVEEPERTGLWLKSGLALGLAALFRGNVLLALPFILVGLVWTTGLDRRVVKKAACLTVLAVAVGFLPALWNSGLIKPEIHHQTLSPTVSGPSNLWLGNGPGSNGITNRETDELARRLANHETTYTREVVGFILERPGEWLKLVGLKAWRFFNGWEVPSDTSYYDLRDSTRTLGWGMLNFAVLWPLGLTGMLRAIRAEPRSGPLLGIVGGYSLAVIGFFILARFRVPLYPFLALFGAVFLHSLIRAGTLARVVWLGLAGALYLAINWDQWLLAKAVRWWSGLAFWALEYGHFL